MIKLNRFYLISYLIFCNNGLLCAQVPRIHSIGESHSFYSFIEVYKPCGQVYHNTVIERSDYEPFRLYIRGKTTLYRAPSRVVELLDDTYFQDHVHYNDICIFSFGEIDCRCHILKQAIEQNRSIESIIDDLVKNYEEALQEFYSKYENLELKVVIAGVIPPLHKYYRRLPVVGTFNDHLRNILVLNQKMKDMAERNNFYFLDLYSVYAEPDGSLLYEYSDTLNHLGSHVTYKAWDELLRVVDGE